MNLLGVMEVSGSALQAERVRAEVVAANMANAETTRTADGGPYRRQQVVFQQAGTSFADSLFAQDATIATPFAARAAGGPAAEGGVVVAGVVTDPSPPLERYDPTHPDANS